MYVLYCYRVVLDQYWSGEVRVCGDLTQIVTKGKADETIFTPITAPTIAKFPVAFFGVDADYLDAVIGLCPA